MAAVIKEPYAPKRRVIQGDDILIIVIVVSMTAVALGIAWLLTNYPS